MAFTRIILWLGNSLLFCAAIMAFTALVALALLEGPEAGLFAFISLLTGFLGGILVFTSSNTKVEESTSDALIFLLLFWLITPIILSTPFLLGGVSKGVSSAYFEAVSAFTTTGASTLVAEDIPRTFLIWRSLLQWCGGVVAATFAVVVLAALNLSGTGVHKSRLFTLQRGELFVRLIGVGRIIAAIYAAIAAMCFILLLISGTSVVDSACLSLSAISTGGLTPQSGAISSYVSRFGALILAVVCVFGAANIAVVYDLIRLQSRASTANFFTNIEHRGMLALALILITFGLFFTGVTNLFPVIVESVFMITSAGFDYEVIAIDLVPPGILIAMALIGGSALSTAGGIKVIRLLLLLRHAGTDIDRMSHPSRVKLVRFRGQILPDRAFQSIWMYFFGYTIFFAASTLALGAAGLEYTSSVAASAAALSNMGPLLEATFSQTGYADMTSLQLSLLSIIMLAGRVEVLAALAAFSPSIWRR